MAKKSSGGGKGMKGDQPTFPAALKGKSKKAC